MVTNIRRCKNEWPEMKKVVCGPTKMPGWPSPKHTGLSRRPLPFFLVNTVVSETRHARRLIRGGVGDGRAEALLLAEPSEPEGEDALQLQPRSGGAQGGKASAVRSSFSSASACVHAALLVAESSGIGRRRADPIFYDDDDLAAAARRRRLRRFGTCSRCWAGAGLP